MKIEGVRKVVVRVATMMCATVLAALHVITPEMWAIVVGGGDIAYYLANGWENHAKAKWSFPVRPTRDPIPNQPPAPRPEPPQEERPLVGIAMASLIDVAAEAIRAARAAGVAEADIVTGLRGAGRRAATSRRPEDA